MSTPQGTTADGVRRKGKRGAFRGRTVLVTAGPTVEDIDPVRFISNRSSGRMGVALASEAAGRGARVILIHGPLQIPVPRSRAVEAVSVRSAKEMYRVVMQRVCEADVAILCAAVADFTPAKAIGHKLKKGGRRTLQLKLVRTPDILAALGARKRRPLLVGFSAETEKLAEHATEKLLRKNCDMICANNVREEGSGFGGRTNRVTLFRRGQKVRRLPLLSKAAVAARIFDAVEEELKARTGLVG